MCVICVCVRPENSFLNELKSLKVLGVYLQMDSKVNRGSNEGLLEEEDEDDEGDADSNEKEVIYYLPNEEGSESSETIAR